MPDGVFRSSGLGVWLPKSTTRLMLAMVLAPLRRVDPGYSEAASLSSEVLASEVLASEDLASDESASAEPAEPAGVAAGAAAGICAGAFVWVEPFTRR